MKRTITEHKTTDYGDIVEHHETFTMAGSQCVSHYWTAKSEGKNAKHYTNSSQAAAAADKK